MMLIINLYVFRSVVIMFQRRNHDLKIKGLSVLGKGVFSLTCFLTLGRGNYGIGISIFFTQCRKFKRFLMIFIMFAGSCQKTCCTYSRFGRNNPIAVAVSKCCDLHIKIKGLFVLGIGVFALTCFLTLGRGNYGIGISFFFTQYRKFKRFLVIFIMFGPLMMTGVYYAITGSVDWKISWLSIAVGLLVTNIVYSHSVLDAMPDAKMGKKTMAHLMKTGKGQIVLSALINILPYVMVVSGVLLGQMHTAYLSVLAVLPLSIWLVRSLNDYVNHKEVKIEIKPWMGPMGDFEAYRKAGVDWFLLRWLVARNIVMMFCMLLIAVNLIFG